MKNVLIEKMHVFVMSREEKIANKKPPNPNVLYL